MSKLRISEGLSLPLDAVTQTFALLAVRGAGKSNGAAAMAEEMFAAGLPFVVIDPVSSWYGLRSGSDGRPGGGLSLPIFGGKHGDVPLERGAGQFIADLIVEKRLTCVLDLGDFKSEGDKKTFLLDFARRIYQKNQDPLHLFLEEADDYIPQSPMREEKQLLRAWENIVRRGRSRGLGVTLLTQRSAAIAKMVLTQVETLFVLRTTGPQDIAAVEAWVKYHQVDKTLLASLAGLDDGEAWVWSPHYLKKIERFRFRLRRTFDSGATPKNVRGKDARRAATLADVDLDQLRGEMAATIEKAKADDPKELRRRIVEFERELAKKVSPAKAERVEVPVFDEVAVDNIQNVITGELDKVWALAKSAREASHGAFATYRATMRRVVKVAKESPPAAGGPVMGLDRGERVPARFTAAGPARGPVPRAALSSVGTTGMDRRFLVALAQYPQGRTRRQVLTLAGYADSGPVSKSFARLRGNGWMVDDERLMKITPAGVSAAGDFERLPTGDALIDYWIHKLNRMAARFLSVLAENRGTAISRADLLAKAAYADSGPVSKAIALLRRLELMKKDDRSGLALNEETFSS